MKDNFEVAFFNDPHSSEYSRHDNKEEAYEAINGVFDRYKETLQSDGATNLSLQMVYSTPDGKTVVERLAMQPPDAGSEQFTVHADGLVVEHQHKPNAVEMYARLAHFTWLSISDDGEGFDRNQNIYHDASEQTIDLFQEKP